MSKIQNVSFSEQEVYNTLWTASKKGVYTSYIRGNRCRTEDDFFREISASLQFPRYFGENWNALDDCLTDLDWLNLKSLLIFVDDFPYIFSGDLFLQKLLISHFQDMQEYWQKESIPVQIVLNQRK